VEPQFQFRPNGVSSSRQADVPESRPLEQEDWLADVSHILKVLNWYADRTRVGFPYRSPFPRGAESSRKRLEEISRTIEKSRELLELPPDWDGEGSPNISEETWRRATDFLRNQAEWLLEQVGVVIDTPQIAPGPNGSIDIYWRNASAELLVNIPVDKGATISFYGDTKAGSHIAGSMKDSDYNRGLWLWLKEDSINIGR
jgi:hypothetical protein